MPSLLDPVRFARMAGSSVAAPDAAGWVTDFLDAAYYARPADRREVDDLRLAHAIVVTRWWRLGGRRLHLADVVGFHRAFVRARLRRTRGSPRGTLDRDALLEGAEALLGQGFTGGYGDPALRAWGIVFGDRAEREAYRPERRLRHAALGPLSPLSGAEDRLRWHTYAPVPVPSAAGLVALLRAPERWPDAASALGCFTPLRSGGLPGQTFEIEVVAAPASRIPVFQRGYVTATAVLDGGDPAALRDHVAALDAGLAGAGEPPALPEGATPVAAVDLTTHEGHFMGRAVSHLVVFEHEGGAFVRDVGTWDPMPWHLDGAYRLAGRRAQAAFWGEGVPADSMLHQMGLLAGG